VTLTLSQPKFIEYLVFQGKTLGMKKQDVSEASAQHRDYQLHITCTAMEVICARKK